MRQVPYLLIGNGRMAKHFSHYLHLSKIPHFCWHRQSPIALTELVAQTRYILLLISDDVIASFVASHSNLFIGKQLIHFSGAYYDPTILGLHPPMSFVENLYELECYQKIPFFIDQAAIHFTDIFPTLKNPSYYVPPEKKAFYHSLCVLANNFTTILWDKFFREMQQQFNAPKEALVCYLEQTAKNIAENSPIPLTGPLARHDVTTIQKNLQALENDPFKEVYQAFVQLYEEIKL